MKIEKIPIDSKMDIPDHPLMAPLASDIMLAKKINEIIEGINKLIEERNENNI